MSPGMDGRGPGLTMRAVRRQLAAMPNELYLIRLIDSATRKAVPGERLWTAEQTAAEATIRFLRARNREGCDIYVMPHALGRNAGYILLDLDQPRPGVVSAMRADGIEPCAVIQTSPGRLQAWVRVSATSIEPECATAAGKQLARTYGGDPASADWRHLGRLAGFTNRKLARGSPSGQPPWVLLVHAHPCLASRAGLLLESAAHAVPAHRTAAQRVCPDMCYETGGSEAVEIYLDCLRRWRLGQRYSPVDWSVADLWVARYLLRQGVAPSHIRDILRTASPSFPRNHGDPEDYLNRTLQHARSALFPRAARAPV